MKIVFFENGQRFLDADESVMLENEAVFQLILANAMANRETPLSAGCYFGHVEEDGKPVLLFGKVGAFPLTLHQSGGNMEEAVSLLVSALDERGWFPDGYNAGTPVCDLFYDELKKRRPELTRTLHLAMDIMQMDEANDVPVTAGTARLAREEDIPLVQQWSEDFAAFVEQDPSFRLSDEQKEKYAGRVRSGVVWLFETPDGKIVSMASVNRQLNTGCCVSGVYTPPHERGKGYAAANMLALSKAMLEKGNRFVTLYVDKTNPISNHVYKKIGYRILCDAWHYSLKKGE